MANAPATYGNVAGNPAGTISAILKDFYIGPLQEQLNNEVLCLEMFEKAKVSWAGRQAIVPVHVSRNTGVAYKSETDGATANLPDAGHQGVARLSNEATYLYGRMMVTGQAVAAAKQGGNASFIGTLDLEMEKLKSDIRNRANESCVTGGRVIGLTCHRTGIAHGGSDVLAVDGNLTKLNFLLGANSNLDIDFVLVGPEDLGVTHGYKFVGQSGFTTGTAGAAWGRVTAIDVSAGTVSITVNSTSGGDGLSFDLVPTGYAVAVRIRGNDGATTYTASGVYDPDNEPVGILGNLCSPQHFGVERQAGATGSEKALQTFAYTNDLESPDDSREDLSLSRLQNVMDTISTLSGLDPDMILCNPAMRASYISLMNGSVNSMSFNPKDGVSTIDGGVSGIGFNGVPIRASRHVPQGMFIFLSTSTFKLAVLEDGKFADLDGNVLSRQANADAFEGFYKWYYNHYCFRPNANAILAGINGGTQTTAIPS